MAITRDGTLNSSTNDSVTSIAISTTGSVPNGSLVVVCASRFSTSSDPILVGDISTSAGTTGAWTLDKQVEMTSGAGDFQNTAIFSALCTGAGAITAAVVGAPAGSYWCYSIGSYSSAAGWDSSRVEATNSNSSTGGSAAVDSGNAASAGQALFVGSFAMDSAGNVTITEDGAFTRIYQSPTGSLHECGGAEDRIVTTGTTDSGSWTITSNPWTAAVVAYREIIANVLLGQIWI